MVELKLGDRVIATVPQSVADAILHLFEEPGMFMSAEVGDVARGIIAEGTDIKGPFEIYENTAEVPVSLNFRGRVPFNQVIRRHLP